VRFPGESATYRTARNKLLEHEIELRQQIEAVAAERRSLPPGGPLLEDYVFDELVREDEHSALRREVRFSELFAKGRDTLVVYSYMFGPQMAAPCSMCTSMLDSLDGSAPHIAQRVNLVVVAKSPINRILEAARGRGWRNLRVLSSAENTYNRDYHGENGKGAQLPTLNVFVRRAGRSPLRARRSRTGRAARGFDLAPLERARSDAGGTRGDMVPEARLPDRVCLIGEQYSLSVREVREVLGFDGFSGFAECEPREP
jgi:predicted dithiol-disulfide oxidoreductase (DUF899 family)